MYSIHSCPQRQHTAHDPARDPGVILHLEEKRAVARLIARHLGEAAA